VPVPGEVVYVRFDHHVHAPHALSQQLVVVVSHLVVQSFVV
jgi:hypothetical protein